MSINTTNETSNNPYITNSPSITSNPALDDTGSVQEGRHQPSLVVMKSEQEPLSIRFNNESYRPKLDKPDASVEGPGKSFDGKMSEAGQSLEADIFAIMAMIQELAHTQKKGALEIRNGEYKLKWKSLENAGKEMRESAGKEFAAALIQGAVQIVSGAVSAKITIKSSTQTHALMKDTKLSPTEFQGKIQIQQNMGNIGQTYTQLGQGVGTIAAAPLTYSSKLDQEEQKQYEAESEKHSANIDSAKDFIQTMKDIMADVRAKLSAMEQSRHETRQKIFS
ncbi:hypothetical protein BTA51_14260 [Hahella sp. CCB-MM4]|uniref:hypothetical protein n=1 Tax=Hahella sp. (strain CCB-MM4) TaxID=1926491 RepID=UPI000B9C08BF|nr:hypothetical protein [Hahella sp. CCB-MM4]OZG72689.1 hypothetical protein BTA51_14260 [Hahella sp. CCB-MM4]